MYLYLGSCVDAGVTWPRCYQVGAEQWNQHDRAAGSDDNAWVSAHASAILGTARGAFCFKCFKWRWTQENSRGVRIRGTREKWREEGAHGPCNVEGDRPKELTINDQNGDAKFAARRRRDVHESTAKNEAKKKNNDKTNNASAAWCRSSLTLSFFFTFSIICWFPYIFCRQ